jgi:hypothetical protein
MRRERKPYQSHGDFELLEARDNVLILHYRESVEILGHVGDTGRGPCVGLGRNEGDIREITFVGGSEK